MYIRQKQLDALVRLCQPGKVVAIYGPRRCGKTTLVSHFIDEHAGSFGKTVKVSGDDAQTRAFLSSQSIEGLKSFVGDAGLLVVDEAQRINEIGLNLKIIVDNVPGIAVIATGSSSFDLASQIREPLTGRSYSLRLFPLAQMEISAIETSPETFSRLETRLIYGSYPETVTAAGDVERALYLREMAGSYLYRDVLSMGGIRHADKIDRLLQLVALQIGHDVSLAEIGRQIEMDGKTVAHYLDLMEKSFVLYRLGGFSRNLRKEIAKNCRYYFWDVGVRNAVIGNFNPLAARADAGQLWENYIIMERAKRREYVGPVMRDYFWRTHTQQEIDLVEEGGGALCGYEIKWGDKPVHIPSEWAKAYPDASFETVNRSNYLKFII